MECELLQLVSAGSGLAAQHLNSEARREICLNPPLLPAAAAHFMPLNNSPSNNHRPLQWQWRGPALRECLDSVHGQPSKLKHFFNFAPINSAPRGHPSVCPRWCPQMSAPGCRGWGRGPSAQTRTSHQPGGRHQLLKDKMD